MACLLTRLIEKILYLPPKRRYISNHPRFNNNYHETYAEFRSDAYGEGKIAYYHLDRKMPLTILYLHGNAEDLASISSYLHWLSYSLKVDIISFDYPGYGQTSGKANEQSIKKCAEAFVSYIINTLEIDPREMIIYGHSLGTAVAAHLGYWMTQNHMPPAGLILQSAFTSVYEVAFDFRRTARHDMFRTIDIIDKIECPITLIHGIDDFLIPKCHSERLYMKIKPQYRFNILFVEHAGHNNIESRCWPRELYFGHMNKFFERTKQQLYYTYYYTKVKDSSSSVPSTETEYLANDKNPLLRNSSGLRLFFTPKANCSPSSLPLSLTNETNEMNVSGNGSTLGRGSTISDTPEVHTSPNEYMRNSEDEDTLRPRRPSLLDSIRSKMNGKSPSSGTMSQPLL